MIANVMLTYQCTRCAPPGKQHKNFDRELGVAFLSSASGTQIFKATALHCILSMEGKRFPDLARIIDG